ncbi:MAG: hypothetical protein ACM3QX_18390 [Syntrophomonadaceae bacterium]
MSDNTSVALTGYNASGKAYDRALLLPGSLRPCNGVPRSSPVYMPGYDTSRYLA